MAVELSIIAKSSACMSSHKLVWLSVITGTVVHSCQLLHVLQLALPIVIAMLVSAGSNNWCCAIGLGYRCAVYICIYVGAAALRGRQALG